MQAGKPFATSKGMESVTENIQPGLVSRYAGCFAAVMVKRWGKSPPGSAERLVAGQTPSGARSNRESEAARLTPLAVRFRVDRVPAFITGGR